MRCLSGFGVVVFSAHAEVVPLLQRSHTGRQRILRACGGSSSYTSPPDASRGYSPRMRR